MLPDRNCCNTSHIHKAAYQYYKGSAIEAPAIEGVGVEMMRATGIDKQGYLGSLLNNAMVVRYLAQSHPDVLREFHQIAEIVALSTT